MNRRSIFRAIGAALAAPAVAAVARAAPAAPIEPPIQSLFPQPRGPGAGWYDHRIIGPGHTHAGCFDGQMDPSHSHRIEVSGVKWDIWVGPR